MKVRSLTDVSNGVLGVILADVLLCAAMLARELPHTNTGAVRIICLLSTGCTGPERHTFNVIPISLQRSRLPTSTGARRMSAFPTDLFAGNGWVPPCQESRLVCVTPCTRRTLTILTSPHKQLTVLLHYYSEAPSWKTPFTASASIGVLVNI